MKNCPRTTANKTGTRLVIWAVLAVLLLAFIWGNSFLSVRNSTDVSVWVMKLVTPLLEKFVGAGNVTDHLVRKIAHFVEFAALGFVLYWVMRLAGRRRSGAGSVFSSDGRRSGGSASSAAPVGFRALCRALFWGFFAGFLDETIQVFTGRGPQITDVWLDFAGLTCGALLAALIGLLVRERRD
jgi:VanZ family protein